MACLAQSYLRSGQGRAVLLAQQQLSRRLSRFNSLGGPAFQVFPLPFKGGGEIFQTVHDCSLLSGFLAENDITPARQMENAVFRPAAVFKQRASLGRFLGRYRAGSGA